MFYIDGDGVMHMTKGDYIAFEPEIAFENNGETYKLGENDTITFTVRALPDKGSTAIIRYTTPPGVSRIVIMPGDTENAEPGKYSADMQLNFDGYLPRTIWPTDNARKQSGKTSNFRNFILEAEVS